MTAAQLTHLVELATYASGFFYTTDPDAARMFADAALRAEALSAELGREEEHARQRTWRVPRREDDGIGALRPGPHLRPWKRSGPSDPYTTIGPATSTPTDRGAA